jgi:hypothetical protein
MQNASLYKKQLENLRFIHLAILYTLAILVFLFTTLPHKWWILLTVLVVSAAVEPGLLIRRSVQRMFGTMLALIFLIPFICILQLNYRLISIVFVLSIVGVSISSANSKRYDIMVFFITVSVFLLLAQTSELHTSKGPIEMVFNRAICTSIGIALVIAVDYFLFRSYNYSQKLYAYNQLITFHFLKNIIAKVELIPPTERGVQNFLDNLTLEITQLYTSLDISAENIKLDLKSDPILIGKVENYQQIMWEVRRVLSAYIFSKAIFPSPEISSRHLERYKQLLSTASGFFMKAR